MSVNSLLIRREEMIQRYMELMKRYRNMSHSKRRDTAREIMKSEFPEFSELCALITRGSREESSVVRGFLSVLANKARSVPVSDENGAQPKLDIGDAQSSTEGDSSSRALLESWFENNKRLRATFMELSHFTGLKDNTFSWAKGEMEKKGWEFERKDSFLSVIKRPDDKAEIKREMSELWQRLQELDDKLNRK